MYKEAESVAINTIKKRWGNGARKVCQGYKAAYKVKYGAWGDTST
jgi:hypothetical protein